MIIKTEIDVSWVGEGYHIDEVVKKELVKATVNAINDKIKEEITTAATNTLNEKIHSYIDNILTGFMEREVKVTDKWGDTVETYDSVNDLLKQKFDDYITQEVNNKGEVHTKCSYGEKYTRIKWLIDDRIKKHVDAFMSTVSKDFNNKLKEALSQSAKDKFAKALIENSGLSKLVENLGN